MLQDSIDQPRLRRDACDKGGSGKYRYVEAPEFIALATSTKKFVRADEAKSGLHGLYDPHTGDRVVIEYDKLQEAIVTGLTHKK